MADLTPLCDPCKDGEHDRCEGGLTDAQYDRGDCCCLLDDPIIDVPYPWEATDG